MSGCVVLKQLAPLTDRKCQKASSIQTVFTPSESAKPNSLIWTMPVGTTVARVVVVEEVR
jgi:hypothetical protein